MEETLGFFLFRIIHFISECFLNSLSMALSRYQMISIILYFLPFKWNIALCNTHGCLLEGEYLQAPKI